MIPKMKTLHHDEHFTGDSPDAHYLLKENNKKTCIKWLTSREKMVGVARFELATPAMSTQCSTTELYAHAAAASSRRPSFIQAYLSSP